MAPMVGPPPCLPPGAGVPRPQPHQPGLQVPPLLPPHPGRVRRQGGQLALQVPQEEEGKYHRATLQIKYDHLLDVLSPCQCRSKLWWQDCEQLALGWKYAVDTLHKLHPGDPPTGSHFSQTHQHCLILLLGHTLESFRRGLSSPQPRLLYRLTAGKMCCAKLEMYSDKSTEL